MWISYRINLWSCWGQKLKIYGESWFEGTSNIYPWVEWFSNSGEIKEWNTAKAILTDNFIEKQKVLVWWSLMTEGVIYKFEAIYVLARVHVERWMGKERKKVLYFGALKCFLISCKKVLLGWRLDEKSPVNFLGLAETLKLTAERVWTGQLALAYRSERDEYITGTLIFAELTEKVSKSIFFY